MNRTVFILFCIVVMIIAGIYFLPFGSATVHINSMSENPTNLSTSTIENTSTTAEGISPEIVTSTIATPVPTTTKSCRPSGCSSQVCSEEDVVTDCMYREEYICYQKAKCERQPDGKCGWSETTELKACLLQYE